MMDRFPFQATNVAMKCLGGASFASLSGRSGVDGGPGCRRRGGCVGNIQTGSSILRLEPVKLRDYASQPASCEPPGGGGVGAHAQLWIHANTRVSVRYLGRPDAIASRYVVAGTVLISQRHERTEDARRSDPETGKPSDPWSDIQEFTQE